MARRRLRFYSKAVLQAVVVSVPMIGISEWRVDAIAGGIALVSVSVPIIGISEWRALKRWGVVGERAVSVPMIGISEWRARLKAYC